MPNTEVIVKAEGLIKYKSDKTGATVKNIGFAKGGIRIAITRYRIPILNNDGSLSHWKETRKPDVNITINKLVQDSATDLVNDSTNGFEAKNAGQTVPTGTIAYEGKQADATFDCIQFAKCTNVSLNRSQADDGDTWEMAFQTVGEPAYGSTQLA